MSLTVIIAEKADAGRRIAYFLSEGKARQTRNKGISYFDFQYDNSRTVLVSLSGHMVEIDFPDTMKNWQKTDLKDLIDAEILKNVKNRKAANEIKILGKGVDRYIIATDYDREGELIGVEALEVADAAEKNVEIKRAKFSALTRDEVKESFSNLIPVDYNLADSAYAREIIDLVWGAVLTRFFSLSAHRYGKDFLSAGRVQTPTLALVVKREDEIRNFVPETYYRITVTFDEKGKFTGNYEGGNLFSKKEAEELFAKLKDDTGKVLDYSMTEEVIYKPPPFNTTEFLREASRIGVVPSKAMKIAESLYTRGLISYPRTDNTVYQRSISLKGVLNRIRESEFRKEVDLVLNQEKIRPSRGRTETTDHPPIYPVNAPKGKLTGDYAKIYELVVRRFLATLFREGKREKRVAKIQVNGINFLTEGIKVTDRGWLELYPYRKVKESYHPDLKVGNRVSVVDRNLEEDKTKPPPRYNLSSLLKLMEDLMLGTKSTRHDIIDKLQTRGFIEGNPVKATPLGIGFINAVKLVDSRISEPEMTATLEEDMEKITKGENTRENVVVESKDMLKSVLLQLNSKKDEVASEIRMALEAGEPIGLCPTHGTDIVISRDRSSSRLRCVEEGCRIDFQVRDRGKIELLDENCPECKLPMIKIIRRGQSPQKKCMDPSCRYNKEKSEFGLCPKDGGILVMRQSRYGKRFLGCSNYPDCDQTYPLPQMGTVKATGEKCPVCSSPLIVSKRRGSTWTFCPDMNCEYNKQKKAGKGDT